MKILTILLLTLSFSIIFNKEKNSLLKDKSNSNKNSQISLRQFPDFPLHTGQMNDPYILQHQAIPGSINNDLNPGIIEHANTFITDGNYYDGRNNLSAIHVDCNVYTTNPPSCVKQSGCGWCGEKNACVSGTATGPLSPCLRSTFLYSMPTPEWSPLKAGTINILAVDSKGQPLNHLTPEPKLATIDVNNPYK